MYSNIYSREVISGYILVNLSRHSQILKKRADCMPNPFYIDFSEGMNAIQILISGSLKSSHEQSMGIILSVIVVG